MLDFAEDNSAGTVLHFVEDWDANRSLGITRLCWKIIEDIDESRSLVPAASVRGNRFDNVGAGETRDGYPENIVFGVSALRHEGRKTFPDLVPALLFPHHRAFVHFVYDNDNFTDA